MIRIDCPFCGLRDEAEFTYRGDASVTRPGLDAAPEAFHDFVYRRANPRGWHLEWWHHSGGCRSWLIVERDTDSHEVFGVTAARERKLSPQRKRAS